MHDKLGLTQGEIKVGAVCVYHHLIKEAKKNLPNNIPVAAVSTGFPAGLSSFKTRKQEITESIKNCNSSSYDFTVCSSVSYTHLTLPTKRIV